MSAEWDTLGWYTLDCKAGEGSWLSFSIRKLDAKTDDEMKAYLLGITKPMNLRHPNDSPELRAYLQRIIKPMNFGDAKIFNVSEIKETTTPTHLKLFRITWAGLVSGMQFSDSETAFSPKKGTWFAVHYSEMEENVNPVENWGAVAKILDSITPISKRKP